MYFSDLRSNKLCMYLNISIFIASLRQWRLENEIKTKKESYFIKFEFQNVPRNR